MSKPKLIIMVGNIASGKSTWIRNTLKLAALKIDPIPVVVSKDALRRMIGGGRYIYDEQLEPIIHSCIMDIAIDFMQEGKNIIIDETNMDRETRYSFLYLTKKFNRLGYDYQTEAVIMPRITMAEVIQRIANREGKEEWAQTPKHIWEQVWRRKNGLFKMPTHEEGFDVVTMIGKDGKEILPV